MSKSRQRLYPLKPTGPTNQRRAFLQAGGSGLLSAGIASSAFAQEPASWSEPGKSFTNYGQPDQSQRRAIRWISSNPAVPGEGVSWTPLHELEGTITPNGLHFERHHNGVPVIEASQWSLVLSDGQSTALSFDLEDLHRYPMRSQINFIECGGNSNAMWRPQPLQAEAGHLHGLVSGCEWTGVPLSILLDEAGMTNADHWLIVDGMDASGVSVSLPIEKCLDDVLVALFQNGEAIRPENGFPARLVVPGWEGIVNVKWLHSITLSSKPLMSRFDTVSYTDLHRDGIARRMTYEMGVKSIITSPSGGQQLGAPGVYEVRGLAWSGAGKITRVDVSADGGRQWFAAVLQEPVLPHALTRFRLPWQWNGQPQVLMSRATDNTGKVQPTRESLLAKHGGNTYYHFNGICAWQVESSGAISHVYG